MSTEHTMRTSRLVYAFASAIGGGLALWLVGTLEPTAAARSAAGAGAGAATGAAAVAMAAPMPFAAADATVADRVPTDLLLTDDVDVQLESAAANAAIAEEFAGDASSP